MHAVTTQELIRTRHQPDLLTHPLRRTVEVIESIEIDRSASVVWDAIADYSFDLEWRLGIVEMSPEPAGPPQNGTRIREVLRSSGLTFVTNATVFDVDPGVSYRFSGSGTTGIVSGLRWVEPIKSGEHAVFTYRVELQPKRHYRLLRPVLKGALASGMRKDLRRLKSLLEHSTN
jgi:Polyketide cyclase / dehydrase and lipid transport